MSEYLCTLLFVAFAVSVASFILYNEKDSCAHFAFGVLLCFAVFSPIVRALPELDIGGLVEKIQSGALSDSPAYTEHSKEALEDGVRTLVCERFSLDEASVSVKLSGFDFENMCADKIELTLFDKAALADLEKIEKYASSLGVGECEVLIGL